MKTLHDNEVRLRDAAAGPTSHEIDHLIPDLTEVDIHEHFPEMLSHEPRPLRRAERRVRWLGRMAALAALLAVGALIALLLSDNTSEELAVSTFGAPTPRNQTYTWRLAPNPGGLPTVGNSGFSFTVDASPGAPVVTGFVLAAAGLQTPLVVAGILSMGFMGFAGLGR